MISTLRTVWGKLDNINRAQPVVVSATPALVLALGSLNGVDLTDIVLTAIMVAFVVGIWSMCIAADRRAVRATESRTAMLADLDRQIAALDSPITLSKDR